MSSKYEFDSKSREMFYRYPENSYIHPFCIYGNLYYVGNKSVGAHLIDTGEGLILIDTTYPTTVALLIQSIWELGFNPKDIRYILHTHGHFDHFGGTALLKTLSGAQTFLAEGDVKMFVENPELALCAYSRYSYVEPFIPDVIMKDGDVVTLGNTEIRIVTTPGHSDGVISFFTTIREYGKPLIAGMHGGAGMNTMCRPFIEKYHNDHCRTDFLSGIKKVYEEKVDIMLGNHAGHNHTLEKRERMLKEPNGFNPFI
ncbi:MAG: MBL fold metallo-hydrolase, partial [Hungatella sp.]